MSVFSPKHFEELLAKARSGCRESLGKLLEAFRLPLLAGRQKSESFAQLDCGELLQETHKTAVARFQQFQGATEGELFVWLRQILNRLAVSKGPRYGGAKKRDQRLEVSLEDPYPAGALRDVIPDDELTPYSSTSAQERRRILEEAFEQLSPAQKEVIQLHHYEGKSFPEIAVQLGKSTKAVTKTWDRALKAWRAAMTSLGVEEDT